MPTGRSAARPTIADIAKAAGVSKGAVSFALNGRPGVSEATRARILRVAQDMDWRPHSAARALGAAKAHAVGLALARPARTLSLEPFFTLLLSGLQAELSAHSMALQLMIVEDTASEIDTYRRWAGEHRVDGLVLVDLRVRDRRPAAIARLGMPAVVVGGNGRPGADLPSVWVDDHEAMASIVEYLASLGHRRIGHVAGMPQFQHTRRRATALTEAAQRLGLEPAAAVATDYSDVEGAAATRRLLNGPTRPTALVYDSDVMAIAGLTVAAELGVSVPAQLSVVSFEDSRLTQLTHPSLTALTRDTYDFGVQAARTLLAAMNDPAAATSIKIATPTLTVRDSTAAPP
jgi:DNA-binding LacI/PurR family transcriptional regulator